MGMPFNPAAYGPVIASILALDGSGERLIPLDARACSSDEARRRLQAASAKQLFPRAAAPDAAMAGLWLYFSCWEEAHAVAQDIATREGSYWHAIVHRQEPDAWNAGYWFQRVGVHPIYAGLRARAAAAGLACGARWDPIAFVELCEQARRRPGSELETMVRLVQKIEWQLLFDSCASARNPQLI